MTDAQWEIFSFEATVAAGVVYFLAMLTYLYLFAALRRVEGHEVGEQRGVAMATRLGLLLTGLAAAVHLAGLVGRGLAADPNRVPWGNMYEFTLAGTFFVAALYLLLYRRLSLGWMGPFVVAFVLTALMAAFLGLDDTVLPLPEALNSPWLVIHVVSAVIATAAFTLGGILSVLYLLQERRQSRAAVAGREPAAVASSGRGAATATLEGPSSGSSPSGAASSGYLSRVPGPATLERLSYRIHAFAFPVWTFAVLITGPIWAHQAWSSYWNWDPKEVWSFITWVVYAAYLHARTTAGWRGRKATWLALIGLATLWFNFIGVNFFSSTSQHSYAEGAEAPASLVTVVEGSAAPVR